jgi:hypothetical protein
MVVPSMMNPRRPSNQEGDWSIKDWLTRSAKARTVDPLVVREQIAVVGQNLLDNRSHRLAAPQSLEREHPQGDKRGVNGRRRDLQRIGRKVVFRDDPPEQFHGGRKFLLSQRSPNSIHAKVLTFWQRTQNVISLAQISFQKQAIR